MLYVSRLEPENNAHVVIEAYARVDDRPAAADRRRCPIRVRLHRPAPRHGRPAGPVPRGDLRHGYRVLRSHATAYVQATEVGGTHPALVEAMGYGNAIVANDVPEHRETLGDAGRYYRGTGGSTPRSSHALARRCRPWPTRLRAAARERAAACIRWDADRRAYYERWFPPSR